jgi:hypothetical protein
VLNWVYTAAAHCQLTLRPAVSAEKRPHRLTGLMPPGRFTGTGNARPVSNTLPLVLSGTVVTQRLLALSKVVVGVEASVENVMAALGTLTS